MPEIIVHGLEKLLEELEKLTSDPSDAIKMYTKMHERLTVICETNQWSPDIVDKTMDVVARNLAMGENITNIKAYIWKVFKNQSLNARRGVRLDSIDEPDKSSEIMSKGKDVLTELIDREGCGKLCLEQLPSPQRSLVLDYYEFENGQPRINKRREMSERLGLTPAALRKRIEHIKEKLDGCLTDCQGKHTKQ